MCSGLVFQMVKDGNGQENDFFSAIADDYTANNVNGTNSIKCSKKNFEGVNVSPGKDKVCWCDERQKQMGPSVV